MMRYLTLLFLLLSLPAFATIIDIDLHFTDGGQAVGNVDFDADFALSTFNVFDWDIESSGGAFPDFHYTPENTVSGVCWDHIGNPCINLMTPDLSRQLFMLFKAGTQRLIIDPAEAGGPVRPSFEAFNNQIRNPIPEPSVLIAMLLLLASLWLCRREHWRKLFWLALALPLAAQAAERGRLVALPDIT